MAVLVNPEFFLALCGVEQGHVFPETTCDGIANNSCGNYSKVNML